MSSSFFLTRPVLAHYTADRGELLWRAGDLFEWIATGGLDVRIGGTAGKLILVP